MYAFSSLTFFELIVQVISELQENYYKTSISKSSDKKRLYV